MSITYVEDGLAEPLADALAALGQEYPIAKDAGDVRVRFAPIEGGPRRYRIRKAGGELVVEYGDLTRALRAVGTILAQPDLSGEVEEQLDFETFGIMLDCSRNAVMKAPHLEAWLRRLALMGFNMAMLYTEDTFALEGEPYFGYQRGAYTAEELRDIDAYARRLGIEMIPCVQTLGHMAQILKWPAYADVKDTRTVMLAEEPKTLALIEKIIRHWSEVFGTRRIHVGMDETHDLGRGVYMDRHGYRDGFEIFNEHLGRVVKLCEQYGLRPMIWSDMYFRLGSKTGDYYDKDARVPDEARAKIPKQAQLVYWDYYHKDEAFYEDWIERHRALGFEPIMGSGVWTWCSVWHATNYTEAKAGACVRACKRAGLKEIFFTMWGDDGSMCDFDSAMTGLTYVSELAYGGEVVEERAAGRYAALCGGDWRASRLAGMLNFMEPEDLPDGDERGGIWGWPTLWDDPLLGIYWNDKKAQKREAWIEALSRYAEIAEELQRRCQGRVDVRGGDLKHALLIARILSAKVALRIRLEQACAQRDTAALRQIPEQALELVKLLDALDTSYRRQWMRRNKPFGIEVIQVRIAGLIRRYREVIDRVTELMEGKIDRIPELESVPAEPARVHPSYGPVTTACDNFA
ncbi:MAG: family 20 glycosylhydrolase [Phycisphaerae bacterium]|nr:family 20 glycosylhydrolase [Phycisphaerae bacterium]